MCGYPEPQCLYAVSSIGDFLQHPTDTATVQEFLPLLDSLPSEVPEIAASACRLLGGRLLVFQSFIGVHASLVYVCAKSQNHTVEARGIVKDHFYSILFHSSSD